LEISFDTSCYFGVGNKFSQLLGTFIYGVLNSLLIYFLAPYLKIGHFRPNTVSFDFPRDQDFWS